MGIYLLPEDDIVGNSLVGRKILAALGRSLTIFSPLQQEEESKEDDLRQMF